MDRPPVGTAVAIGNVDAHVAVPAATVTGPGRMVMIMGTSTCHMVLGTEEHEVAGMCGSSRTGSSRVLRLRGWPVVRRGRLRVVRRYVGPGELSRGGAAAGLDLHAHLQALSFDAPPGASGLLALDWWNGNRSVLVDAGLSGLLIGSTLATTPEETYRALVESTAFGTRVIVEAFQANGVGIEEIVACGGLAEKSPAIVQLYADIVGLPFRISASDQTPALGSAMFGAVAAGSGRRRA